SEFKKHSIQSNGSLFTCLHGTKDTLIMLQLGVTNDHGIADTETVGVLQLTLELALTVGELHVHSPLAQRASDRHQATKRGLAERNQQRRGSGRSIVLTEEQHHALHPDREPDPRIGGSL